MLQETFIAAFILHVQTALMKVTVSVHV